MNLNSRLILIGGGARSGKSSFALRLAKRLGAKPGLLATATPCDAEMAERIRLHRLERGAEFVTIEEPLEVSRALASASNLDVVVLDCLTLWLSNLLLRGDSETRILAQLEALLEQVQTLPFPLIVVTNEVGMSVVPESALGRAFRDLAGRAHQRLARQGGEIYLAALGVILRLRPEPIRLESDHEPQT